MTTELFTPADPYTVAGVGPYTVPHPYAAGALVVSVVEDDLPVALDLADYTVEPASSKTTGAVTLTAGAAAAHAGKVLLITRQTSAQQGWQATLGEREVGLETQLDRMVQKQQELDRAVAGTFRVRGAIGALEPVNGKALILVDGKPAWGPDAADIAAAAGNAATAAASADEAEGFAALAAAHGLPQVEDLAALAALTTGVAVGASVYVRYTGMTYERAADAAGDAHLDYSGSGGFKWYEAGSTYSTFARFAASVARGGFAGVADGTGAMAGGDLYVRASAVSVISGLAGWRGLGVSYDPARVITRAQQAVPERAGNPAWFPATGAPYLNVIIGADGADSAAPIWRSTMVGNSIASLAAHDIDRADLFGDGVLRFGDYVDSLTAVGSLAAQWLGLQAEPGETVSDALRRTLHEFCKEPTDPDLTDPTWDVYGLETANPGLRAQMAAVTLAVSKADNEDNVLVGRNAGLHMIKGKRNTIVGKNALAHGWYNDEVTAVGWDAARNGAMVTRSVFFGKGAGLAWSEGLNNVVIGPDAGIGVTKGNSNIIIGADAAADWSGEVNSLLSIGVYTDRPPLISGAFGGRYVGINIARGDILATGLHVRSGDGGVGGAATVNPAAATAVFEESSGNGGVTILTGNTDVGQVAFSRLSSSTAGSIRYDHSGDEMSFRCDNTLAMRMGAARLGFFSTAPITKPTGVAVSAAAIHAALVSLGLIAA